jgi:17beta-estradiol 17-dehydrogenase / very-long-chain 3-oxoacyl-CoA reductase
MLSVHFVRYVDQFSRSLSVEYKQYGIDVQCQV